ncbi:MAG: Rpn family recombination-promoting nuclease/putative transposase [Phaeodactylibacter sp.]|uniref:Rpn family recombination-promoting nuclease/putative transposase n=1 Tax=Phaeodactylibacter sp. TaxID=1940289 RepID=UPI0032ECC2AB
MKKNKKVFQPDDRFFRQAMSDPQVVSDYLIYFYPAIAAIADLKSLKQEQTTAIHPNLQLFNADVVFRCRFKGEEGSSFYFCLLFEHKSKPEKYVAIQVGLYVFQLMYNVVKQGRREPEPVLPVVFYNGKESWSPKTIGALFDKAPYYETIKEYLPDFNFLFEDVGRLSPEAMAKLELSYFRSLLLTMSMRHKPDLIIQYLDVIFEGATDKDKMRATITYILGVAERSPAAFMKDLEQIEFTTKPDAMSTLEQFLELGREEGVRKERVLTFLQLQLKLPTLSVSDLSELSKLPQETVTAFKNNIQKADVEALWDFLKVQMLDEVQLKKEEKEKVMLMLEQLLEQNR